MGTIQVDLEPGKPGAEVSYKKDFAYKTVCDSNKVGICWLRRSTQLRATASSRGR